MTKLIALAKKLKRFLKKMITPKPYLSFSRRIDCVKTRKRVCAMTFDDGPFLLPCAPDRYDGKCLTDVLLDTLEQYGAKGTFDVVGDTGNNYPDTAGAVGTPAWGGVKYDHYPDFAQDKNGGVLHAQRLIKRMLEGGHQITNHGYRHIIFGKKPFVYGNRVHLPDIQAVMDDLKALDIYMKEQYHYSMVMSRPPHYVDKIAGGYNSHDAYDAMGYLYMAANYDGGGWLPLESIEAETQAMVKPVEHALAQNADAFCGQIIFQKDGYNMAKRTPVAYALGQQLQLLTENGYKIVTVEELLQYSAFADCDCTREAEKTAARLAQSKPVAYSNNCLYLEKTMTNEALALLLAPFDKTPLRRKERTARAIAWCKKEGLLPEKASAQATVRLPLTQKTAEFFNIPKNTTRAAFFGAIKPEMIEKIIK